MSVTYDILFENYPYKHVNNCSEPNVFTSCDRSNANVKDAFNCNVIVIDNALSVRGGACRRVVGDLDDTLVGATPSADGELVAVPGTRQNKRLDTGDVVPRYRNGDSMIDDDIIDPPNNVNSMYYLPTYSVNNISASYNNATVSKELRISHDEGKNNYSNDKNAYVSYVTDTTICMHNENVVNVVEMVENVLREDEVIDIENVNTTDNVTITNDIRFTHLARSSREADSQTITTSKSDETNLQSTCHKSEEPLSIVKMASLNVCGLVTKLRTPDLLDLVNDHDIVCLSETKHDDLDEVDIEGYLCFTKNRKRCLRKSGGVAILVKESILHCVKIVENSKRKHRVPKDALKHYRFVSHPVAEECLIFELNFPGDAGQTFICASVYVPPVQSKYANRDAFNDIADTLSHWDEKNVILLGDFNGRTGTIPDYIDSDTIIDDEQSMTNIMTNLNIQHTRHSEDGIVNEFGNKLIDFCKSQGILIVNGRVSCDKNIGRCTCKDISTVDYALATPTVFNSICHFEVNGFNEMLSDIHCSLTMHLAINQTINLVHENDENDKQNNTYTKIEWDKSKIEQFINAISQDQIQQLECKLNTLNSNQDTINQNSIEEINNDFCSILLNAASKTHMVKTKRPRRNKKKTRQQWFDVECRNKRNIWRKTCKKHNRAKTDENKANRQRAHREYKNTCNSKYLAYKRANQTYLRNVQRTNNMLYWKILNRLTSNNHDTDNNVPSQEDFTKHFENLSNINIDDVTVGDEEPSISADTINCDDLNQEISNEEIMKCISKLKNNKSAGHDKILNEFLKASVPKLLNSIRILFNIVLMSGKIPEEWSVGIICPIYKGKGSKNDVDNYRGITILSCVAKLFTSVLNERIYCFLENNGLLGVEQGGFRKNNSTIDHIFALHCLIDIYLKKKKRLFCTFIDYSKAFDKIHRNILWEKLINTGIRGKILNIIRELYYKAKSCVRSNNNDNFSTLFSSNVGVRQGENLSPVLFALYINDLKESLVSGLEGLKHVANLAEEQNFDDFEVFVKLFLLLYADDTVILAESEKEMQIALNTLSCYCLKNKLKINISKTKVIVFSRGKIRKLPKLKLNNEVVDVAWEYSYLGILFNYNNTFNRAIHARCTAAAKALFSLLKKCRKLDLPLDLQVDLFEKLVKPVLLYGSEVWAFAPLNECDKLQLRFLKLILNVKRTTPNVMVLGELGCLPVSLDAQCRMLCFWYKLYQQFIQGQNKISILTFRLVNALHDTSDIEIPWLNHIKSLLDKLGLSYLWDHPGNYSLTAFKLLIKQRIKDQYIQDWRQRVFENNICITYRLFKEDPTFESYLLDLPETHRKNLLKFRLSCHKLPIQKLRYMNIARDGRLCHICDMQELGDEFHYIFNCTNPIVKDNRKLLLPKYCQNNPNVLKLKQLLNCKSKKVLLKMCKFIKILFEVLES